MTATFEMPATKEAFIQPFRDLLDQCMGQFNACPQQWVLAFPDSEGRPCGLVGSMQGRGIKYVNYTDTTVWSSLMLMKHPLSRCRGWCL